jgi:hypothetical protein
MGLLPEHVWSMTLREFELYAEGYAIRWDAFLEALAWVQANLLNAQIPKGKAKLTVEKLLPRGVRTRRKQDSAPATTIGEAKAKARAAQERRDNSEFDATETGQRIERIKRMLGDDDGGP